MKWSLFNVFDQNWLWNYFFLRPIETVLERPVSQTILANSISLTPGTLSVDLDSENNIIKVAAISPRSKEDIIPFEPYIKKMLE